MPVLNGRALTYFQAFGAHEAAHVDAIVATIQQLGGTPVAPAQHDLFRLPTEAAGIVKVFQNVEAVGAAGAIRNFDALEAAPSIHALEAEHAAALADLVAPGAGLFAPGGLPRRARPMKCWRSWDRSSRRQRHPRPCRPPCRPCLTRVAASARARVVVETATSFRSAIRHGPVRLCPAAPASRQPRARVLR